MDRSNDLELILRSRTPLVVIETRDETRVLYMFEYDTRRFSEVGGLDGLRRWLERRRPAFETGANASHLDPPKGVLLIGVQGCGKSLAARATAGVLGLPLLRLDFATLYNKYHGETERNLRESLATADVMAPCVLWIDELEQVVVSALYAAHAQGTDVSSEHLLAEARATRPLSVVMAERIAALRQWAEGRTVPSH